MPDGLITAIEVQKRRPTRRSVFVDGTFVLGCSVNVVARFRLRVGMRMTGGLLEEIEVEGVRQEAFDAAVRLLSRRRHAEKEVADKLAARGVAPPTVGVVVAKLRELGYLDDASLARSLASEQATLKRHGRRRAAVELRRKGLAPIDADAAVTEVYAGVDPAESAWQAARKRVDGLRRLDPQVARRRLAGYLQRRGYDYDVVSSVVSRALGEDET